MTSALFLLPVFVQAALIVTVGIATGLGRRNSARSVETRLADIALDASNWPEHLRERANSYNNQFQMPMAYFTATAFYLVTGLQDVFAFVLGAIFVASRIVHCAIHVGSNNVVHRFYAFSVGVVTLLIYWIWLAVRVYILAPQ